MCLLSEPALTDYQPIAPEEQQRLEHIRYLYSNQQADAFSWLLATHEEGRALVNDVINTLRALRCADALRQRGTVLKTSGNDEMFVDQTTAQAVYAFRRNDDKLFLLSVANPIAAGEANVASSELSRDGNLRISFHRGAFLSEDVVRRAAYNAAFVVNDIQGDVIESFGGRDTSQDVGTVLTTYNAMHILLEATDDNPHFTNLVVEQLLQRNPHLEARVQIVPSLSLASAEERTRYLDAPTLDWDLSRCHDLLQRVARSGQQTTAIDPLTAFSHVKEILLQAGETLLTAGSPASFVYIPLTQGLRIIPLGGYASFTVRAWMPVGITGVIRGSIRNATVVAEQDIILLMIPKEIYLRYWHHPYDPAAFIQRLIASDSADRM